MKKKENQYNPFSQNQTKFLTKYNSLLKTSILENKKFIQILISFIFLSIIIFDILFHIENFPYYEILKDNKKKTNMILIIGIFLFFNILYIIFFSLNLNSRAMNIKFFRFFCDREYFFGFFFIFEFLLLNYFFFDFKKNSENFVFEKILNLYVFIILQIFIRFVLTLVYKYFYFSDLKNYYDIQKFKKTEVKKVEIGSDFEKGLESDFEVVTYVDQDQVVSISQ